MSLVPYSRTVRTEALTLNLRRIGVDKCKNLPRRMGSSGLDYEIPSLSGNLSHPILNLVC